MLICIGLLIIFPIYNVQALKSELIVGGQDSPPGAHSYHVAINIHFKNSAINQCGGAIIDEFFIITAAHCVLNPTNKEFPSQVAFTTKIALQMFDRTFHVDGFAKKIYVLKSYNFHSLGNDIAVLKLGEPLNLNDETKLRKLKLPTEDSYVITSAVATGNGMDSVSIQRGWFSSSLIGKKNTDRVKFLNVEIIDYDACNAVRSIRDRFWDVIRSIMGHPQDYNFFLSTVKDRTTALQGVYIGDSGSPLVINDDVLLGVLSGSKSGYNDLKYPAVYVKVHSHLEFIKNAMQDKVTETMAAFELDP